MWSIIYEDGDTELLLSGGGLDRVEKKLTGNRFPSQSSNPKCTCLHVAKSSTLCLDLPVDPGLCTAFGGFRWETPPITVALLVLEKELGLWIAGRFQTQGESRRE